MFGSSRGVPGNDGVARGCLAEGPDTRAIGEVQTVTGLATVTRVDGAIVSLKAGDRLHQGDVIDTAAASRIVLSFIDDTSVQLSSRARLVLDEYAYPHKDDASSALFSLAQGAFELIAGRIAKRGAFRLDTPTATIRARYPGAGIGILSLAAMTLCALRDAQASILDDGVILPKDLEHGVVEVTLKPGLLGAQPQAPQVHYLDDPAETLVITLKGSSATVEYVTNSAAQMAQNYDLQQQALATYAIGAQGGPTVTGPNGSSGPTFDIPLQFIPINFDQTNNSTSNNNNNNAPPPPPPAPPNVTTTDPGPDAVDSTAHVIEDQTYTFKVNDFGYSDIFNGGGDPIASVTITSLPAMGVLVYNGHQVTQAQINSGFTVSAADIAAGKLTFVPNTDVLDAGTFQFKVTDTFGSFTSLNTATMTLTVTPDAGPSAADSSVFVVGNHSYAFQIGDFGYSDDNGADPIASVTITSLPATGVLIYNGITQNSGFTVSAADILAGKLVFVPNPGFTTGDSFHFTVTDTIGNTSSANTATMTLTLTSTAAPTFIASAAEVHEDQPSALTINVTNPSDLFQDSTDDSVTITIHGLPAGAAVSQNNVAITPDSHGDYHLIVTTATQTTALSGLTITPPSEFEGQITFTVSAQAHDGAADSAIVSHDVTITVDGTAEAPVIHANSSAGTTTENTAVLLTGLTLASHDTGSSDDNDTFTATLYVEHGTLTVVNGSGFLAGSVHFSGSGTAADQLTITDTLANVQAALAHIQYTPGTEYEGPDLVHFAAATAEDVGTSTAAASAITSAITVSPVAEQPTASAPSTLSLNENAINFAIAGVSVGPLKEDGDDTVSATLTVSHGTLQVGSLIGVTVSNNSSASITLSGDAAQVNTLLAGLTYTPTTGYVGSDQLQLSVTSIDGSNTYPTNATASTTITVHLPDSVIVTGAPAVDEKVVATVNDADNDASSFAYQWFRDGVAISGATSVIYQVTTADAGHQLSVQATEPDHDQYTSAAVAVLSSSSDKIWSDTDDTWNLGTWSSPGTPTSSNDAFLTSNHTITVNTTGNVAHSLTIDRANAIVLDTAGGDLNLGGGTGGLTIAHGTFELWGGTLEAGTIYIQRHDEDNGGIFSTKGNYTLPETIWNDGVVHVVNGTLQIAGIVSEFGTGSWQADSGATLQFNVSATIAGDITDNGTIVAHGGTLEIKSSSAITGSGGFKIDAGAVLQFDGTDALNVVFTGSTGELVLKDPAGFTGTIGSALGHLTSDNQIDLTNIDPTTAHVGTVAYHSGTNITDVQILDNSSHSDTLHLVGDYTTSTWNFAADGSGGTIVDDPPGTSDPAQTPMATHLPGLQIGDQFHFAERAGDPGGYVPDQNIGPPAPPAVQTVAEILSESGRAGLDAVGWLGHHHDGVVTTVQKIAPPGDFLVHA